MGRNIYFFAHLGRHFDFSVFKIIYMHIERTGKTSLGKVILTKMNEIALHVFRENLRLKKQASLEN